MRRNGIRDTDLEKAAASAIKRYYDAIQRQKKIHWENFRKDQDNIWRAAKFLKPGKMSSFSKVPPLIRTDGSVTEGEKQKTRELLGAFYPPLPTIIVEEADTPPVTPIEDPEITMEEVKRKVFSAKPWKAPGRDGIPAAVWSQLWPVMREETLDLFKTSLNKGYLPCQWRVAKMIPLKKPSKPDYRLAKAWRPISLLATLGKILEAILAERISYAIERYSLLPQNHFGARRRRSSEQALILLQGSIYKCWHNRKVCKLISFDVKEAYNGVYAPRLLQRL